MTMRRVCAALTATSVLGTGTIEATEIAEFEALTVSRSGSFTLDLPPREALLLFTAPGEKLWIEEWDPVILHGDGFESGTVFITTNHGPHTYWLVSEFDRDSRHARYVRVTPESHTGTVDVVVSEGHSGGSTVSVTYQLTGLSPAGNEKLRESYSESDYAAMMQTWQSMIQDSRAIIDEHFRDSRR